MKTVHQPSRHPKGYVPLWKQWQQSEEYKEYKKNELPRVLEFHKSLNLNEKDEFMKEFQLRWVSASTGKVEESTHKSEKSAKDRARELSFDNAPVQVGEVDGGKLLQQWNYDKGRQQPMNTKKQVTVAPISKKEASQLETNETKGGASMATKAKGAGKGAGKATKTGQEGQEKPTGKAQKATGIAGKAKSQPLPTAAKPEPRKTGTVRDQFGLREGTVRAKLVDTLLDAKGKPVPVPTILKAMYGAAKDEFKAPLNMSLKGMQQMIDKNKIKLQIVREKDSKGGATIALKTK